MILGTVRRIGCSLFLLVLGAVAWHFRDMWLPQAMRMIRERIG